MHCSLSGYLIVLCFMVYFELWCNRWNSWAFSSPVAADSLSFSPTPRNAPVATSRCSGVRVGAGGEGLEEHVGAGQVVVGEGLDDAVGEGFDFGGRLVEDVLHLFGGGTGGDGFGGLGAAAHEAEAGMITVAARGGSGRPRYGGIAY